MSNHTPGPWIIADDGTIEAKHLGRVGFLTHASPEDSALIAAAPDMYAALKELETALLKDSRDKTISGDTVEYHLDGQAMYAAINHARAAIAKAEGRS